MKTANELAAEYAFKYAKDTNSSDFLKAFNSYIAGYTGAEQNGVRSNYNDHKLVEANKTIENLKERIRTLSKGLEQIQSIGLVMQEQRHVWGRQDLEFENHDKVGPWAGFFPVKKDDV